MNLVSTRWTPLAGLMISVGLACAGCKFISGGAPSDPVPPADRFEGFVQYGDVEVEEALTPPAYAAPLDVLTTDRWPASAPPRSWVEGALCGGDVAVWQRVAESLDRALGGPEPLAAELRYGMLFAGCRSAATCDLGISWRIRSGGARHLADLALSACDSETVDPLLASSDTSPAAVALRFLDLRPVTDPDLVSAGRSALVELERAQPRAVQTGLLRALLEQPPREDFRVAWCADPSWRVAPEKHPCLEVLAMEDWHAARALVAAGASPEARTLREHASADAWEASLRRAGVLVGTVHRTYPRPLDVPGLLGWYGQTVLVDGETGRWPNQHDALLARLAALGGWTDVVFAERAPPLDGQVPPDAAPAGKYVLMGWSRGRRYTVVGEDLDDWYDVPAVLSLLNGIARDRGDDVRWFALPTDGQEVNFFALSYDALIQQREFLGVTTVPAASE